MLLKEMNLQILALLFQDLPEIQTSAFVKGKIKIYKILKSWVIFIYGDKFTICPLIKFYFSVSYAY